MVTRSNGDYSKPEGMIKPHNGNQYFPHCNDQWGFLYSNQYQFGCGISRSVGPKKARFLAKNQHTQRKKTIKNPYQSNFLKKKKSFKNINLVVEF